MGEKKAKKGEGEKETADEQNGITAVLKTEMHCEGCATKILKCVKTMEGVEKAKADWEANKLTVRGQMDPSVLREELQERLKKKVELVSSQLPKKDKDGNKDGDGKKSDSKGSNKKEDDNKSSKDSKKSDDKKLKEKEAPVTTAVLKLRLHCMGCIFKIYKIASKIKGVDSISIDKEKELVTMTGTMDVKALAESLEEKMKRKVEIVPPKKDKEGEEGGNKSTAGDGGVPGKKDKKKDGEGEDRAEAAAGGNRMEHYLGPPTPMVPNYGHMYGPAAGHGYLNPYPYHYPENNFHAPQIFSDENPNACSVM